MFKLQEKPSALKREHQAFQKIKFFLCWTFFALLDLDPDIEFRSGYGSRDPIGYGSRDPIESRKKIGHTCDVSGPLAPKACDFRLSHPLRGVRSSL
jgi:hypothetical protein